MLYVDALQLAEKLRDDLAPGCERIEVAGEVRRRAAFISKIVLVAVPKIRPGPRVDFFAFPPQVSRLDDAVRAAVASGLLLRGPGGALSAAIAPSWDQPRTGAAHFPEVLPVEVVAVEPPAEWGPVMARLTGPDDFARQLASRMHRWGRLCVDGRVLERGVPVPCPEEEDFFRLAGARLVPPWVRGVVEIERADGACAR